MNDRRAEGLEEELTAYLKQGALERGKPVPALGPHDEFFDSGILDSLSLLDFVSFLERRCGIDIPGADIAPENLGTLSAVVEYLKKRLAPQQR